MKHTASQDTLVPRLASTKGFEHDPNSAPHRIASTARAARGASTIRRILARVSYSTAIIAGACFFHAPAHATQIIAFGQVSGSNTLTATANGAGTATALSTDTAISITQLFGNAPTSGFLDLNASSIDAAVGVGPALLQHYSGTFAITSLAGGLGTNFLSGTFSDAAFGLATGEQLSINVASPPDTLALTSGVIAAADLVAPSSFTLSLSNVLPALSLDNATLASFTASYSGVASATTEAVPEPASLALLGVGLLALSVVRKRRA